MFNIFISFINFGECFFSETKVGSDERNKSNMDSNHVAENAPDISIGWPVDVLHLKQVHA